jgi:hypothetical protein
MRIVLHAAIVPLAFGVALGACAQKRTTATARSAAPSPAPVETNATPVAEAPEKQPRVREAGVYVDGKEVGVLRKNELPTSLKSITVNLGDGFTGLRWRFTDYAKSVGVEPTKIRAMHLYGGKHIATISGEDLARPEVADGLRFGFSMNDRGKAQAIWPGKVEIHSGGTIDMISAVAFYVEKEPPRIEHSQAVMADGTVIDDRHMPYEQPDGNAGTRVYVDGTLVGAVKRKRLTNDLLVNKDDETSRFGLMAYAQKLGVDTTHAKTVDLLAGDDVVGRETAADANKTSFRVPQRNQGKILVDLPEGTAKISAVQIYVKQKPPVRDVVKLDDAPAAAPGAGNREGPDDEGI